MPSGAFKRKLMYTYPEGLNPEWPPLHGPTVHRGLELLVMVP